MQPSYIIRFRHIRFVNGVIGHLASFKCANRFHCYECVRKSLLDEWNNVLMDRFAARNNLDDRLSRLTRVLANRTDAEFANAP